MKRPSKQSLLIDYFIKLRQNKGLTQQEVAYGADINRSHYCEMENHSKDMHVETFRKLCAFHGKDPAKVMDDYNKGTLNADE